MGGFTSEQIKQCEDYLKSTTHCKIVRAYGRFIILAHDKLDYQSKANRIINGNTLGFYVIERVLEIIKTKPC